MSRSVRGDGSRREKWLACLNKGLKHFTKEQVDNVLSNLENLRNFDLPTLERTQDEYSLHYGSRHEEVQRWIASRRRQSSSWRAEQAKRVREVENPAELLVGLLSEG